MLKLIGKNAVRLNSQELTFLRLQARKKGRYLVRVPTTEAGIIYAILSALDEDAVTELVHCTQSATETEDRCAGIQWRGPHV